LKNLIYFEHKRKYHAFGCKRDQFIYFRLVTQGLAFQEWVDSIVSLRRRVEKRYQ